MKRILILVLFASLSASFLVAQTGRAQNQFSSSILDEVARLSAAGTSDSTLIAYIHGRRSRLESPSADDLIRLKQAGVSEKVIEYLAGLSTPRDRGRERRRMVRNEDAWYGYGGFYSPFFYPRSFVFRGGFGHRFHGRR